ncbi:MAG: acetyltransferase-like isoleucine patch superfamily enzyme [Halioglobus sp.]|jgi:acetyltransferase-like isoleucine patch superfamily enzyme
MDYLDIAKSSIERFSLDATQYKCKPIPSGFKLNGNVGENAIYIKDTDYEAEFQINFNKTKGCRVFIGRKTRGDVLINFNGDNSTVYIGDNCDLKQLQIRSRQNDDFIAIGEEVSVAGNSIWVSGYGAGNQKPAIIIGDDCMFSYDIVIRNSDAHPIFDMSSDLQINQPRSIVHIEPHVWVGERASVLKDITIGACSVIAMSSTVTRDVPRFSTARGVPATAARQENIYWARDHTDFAIQQAKYYTKKYQEA